MPMRAAQGGELYAVSLSNLGAAHQFGLGGLEADMTKPAESTNAQTKVGLKKRRDSLDFCTKATKASKTTRHTAGELFRRAADGGDALVEPHIRSLGKEWEQAPVD